MENKYKDFYNQEKIKQELLRLAKNKEVQGWFSERRGMRPDCLNMMGDIHDMVRNGLTSIHFSEELWKNPLELKPGMPKRKLDELRIGWDLLLDIDSKIFEHSRIVGALLVEALKFHGIKNISVKFSGNHGFHIGVCFESFPDEVNGIKIKNFFPDGVRIVANYLKEMIREFVVAQMLERQSLDEIIAESGVEKKDAIKDGKFDPYEIVDIDSVLISSRHMFRGPYSVNEKSGLVSIPIDDIKTFNREDAKVENVKFTQKFLDREKSVPGEASHLLIQALDWYHKKVPVENQDVKVHKEYETPKEKIEEEFFPDCIKKLMSGVQEDGRKRGVFVLICFLRNMGWSFEDIDDYLKKWNDKAYEPLREGYIRGQLSWFKRQGKVILPPNCGNDAYYKNMGIKCLGTQCSKFKNPVNVALTRLKISQQGKRKKKKKVVKKEDKEQELEKKE